MKLLEFTDPHCTRSSEFSKPTGDGYNEYLQLFLDSFKFVEDTVRQTTPDILAFGGDFWDARDYVDTMSLNVGFKVWQRMSKLPVKYKLAIVGNHDYFSIEHGIHTLEVLKGLGWTVFEEPGVVDLDGLLLAGIPYRDEYDLDALRAIDKQKPSVVLSHVDVIGGRRRAPKSDRDKKAYSDSGVPASVFSDAGVVLNGHYHHPAKVADNWYNIGSLTSRTFHDKNSSPRGVVVYDTETKELTRFHNPHARNFIDIHIEDEDDLAEVLDSDYGNTYARIYYNLELEDEAQTVKELFAGARLLPIAKKASKVEATTVDLRFSLEDNLERYIDEQYDDKRLRELALEIFRQAAEDYATHSGREALDFGELEIHYYQSIRHLRINLHNQGLLFVRGINNDDPGQDGNGCLSGDTLIDCPRDLVKYPKGIPIKELVGSKPYVYCWDNDRITIRKASKVFLSKNAAPVVRVKLTQYTTSRGSNLLGQYIPPLELVGTEDHPVLLSDGVTWKRLGDLSPGDSLCSMYRKKSGGWRTLIRWTGLQTTSISEQQFVCSEVHGPAPEGAVVHHIDHNSYNHHPANLTWIDQSEHSSYHLSEMNKRGVTGWKVSGVHPRGMLGLSHSEETRQKISNSVREKRGPNHSVISVEPAGVMDVYDMTVPGVHNFIANGVVVHNSGKSSMAEALYWCLTGKSLRGFTGNEVIHWDADYVRVSQELFVGDKVYTLIRSRKDPEYGTGARLFAGGKSIGARLTADTETKIEDLIGRSDDSLRHVCFMTAGLANRFSKLSYPQRARLLEDIIDSKPYHLCEKLANERLSSVKTDLTRNQGALDSLLSTQASTQSRIDELRRELEEFEESNRDDRENWEARVKALTDDTARDVSKKSALEVEVATLTEEIRNFRSKQVTLDETLRSLSGDIASIRAQVAVVDSNISRFGSLYNQEVCPTCEQSVDQQDVSSKLSSLNTEKSGLDQAIKDLVVEFNRVEDRKMKVETAVSSREGVLSDKHRAIAAANRRIQDNQSAKTEFQQAIHNLNTGRDNLNASLVEREKELDRLQPQILELMDEEEKLEEQESKLSILAKEVFDEKGVRNSILSQVAIPYMNARIPEYAQYLWGGRQLELSGSRSLKGGSEKNEIDIVMSGNRSYKGNSSGEKRRVDLILQFALNDLASATGRSRIGLLVVDEAFDTLDESGIYAAKEALSQKDAGTILMVSHRKYAAAICPRQITLIKENESTRLLEAHTEPVMEVA